MTVTKSTKPHRGRPVAGTRDPSLQQAGVDFGRYHHSTTAESREIGDRAEMTFSEALRSLYPPGARLRILDAGCGLGFLTYVAAKCFPKARITGVDLFSHGSISGISMEKARDNMKSLGIEARTSFLKHDLTKPMEADARYNLIVSNLVFHNIGKKRFKAYDVIFSVLKPGGFFVIGDLFPHGKADDEYFRERSTLIKEWDEGAAGPWVYRTKVLRRA